MIQRTAQNEELYTRNQNDYRWAVLEVSSDNSTEWGAVYQKSPMNDYRGVSEVELYTCNYQNTC